MAMLLSMMIVLQVRSEINIRTNFPTRRVSELLQINSTLEQRLQKSESEISVLRSQLQTFDRDRELERLRIASGLVPLQGRGLRITLSDSEKELKEYEDPIFYIVHYDQLELLVNELFAAGAEAVAVNGYRIGNTTGFSCAGTTILVDTRRIAPPYIIEAIGDSGNLKNALMMPGSFVEQQILSFDLKFMIETSDSIYLPAYSGSIDLKHAEMASEK